jgi:hypothetical protein
MMPRWFCLRSLLLILVVLILPASVRAQPGCLYLSIASGAQVVPPTQGGGWASLYSDFIVGPICIFRPQEMHDFQIAYGDIGSAPIGAYIHRGAPGENGEVFLALIDGPFQSGTVVSVNVDSTFCAGMLADSLYFVVSTAVYPTGAVRGPVQANCDESPTMPLSWGSVRSLYR